MQMDKAVKDKNLDDLNVYDGVRTFFGRKLKNEFQLIVESAEYN
jgi:hypothetical protein